MRLLYQAGKDLRGNPSGRAILSPCTPEGSMELPWKGRSEVTVGGCPEGAVTYGSPSPSLSRPGGAARIAPHCRTPVPPFQGGGGRCIRLIHFCPCRGAQAKIRRKSAQSIPCTKKGILERRSLRAQLYLESMRFMKLWDGSVSIRVHSCLFVVQSPLLNSCPKVIYITKITAAAPWSRPMQDPY